MNILDYIPTGKVNAITREYLCQATGMNDRKVREHIAIARREAPIVNLSGGQGYYVVDVNNALEMAELKHFIKQEESRIKSIGYSLQGARHTLRPPKVKQTQIPGQMDIMQFM